MSNNIDILIVGAGYMAMEYCKVLNAMDISPIVIGRGDKNAKKFEETIGVSVLTGGLKNVLPTLSIVPTHAIVAVSIDALADTTNMLIEHGIKNILVEKPAGVNRCEIQRICDIAYKKKSKVWVAYNRRFYASVDKALEMIKKDGGVTSFNFEFTEWGHVISKTTHSKEIKNIWLLANSTHVMDLAFFLGGFPVEMSTYVMGKLDWHEHGCIYAGAGVSEKGALFSYQANWAAPGRWVVEILTNKHRFYFKPMEELSIQDIGSVSVNKVEIDDELDKKFKPGLYRQTKAFIENTDEEKKLSINDFMQHFEVYEKIDKTCSY